MRFKRKRNTDNSFSQKEKSSPKSSPKSSQKEKSSPKSSPNPLRKEPNKTIELYQLINRKIDCIFSNQPREFPDYDFYEKQMINLIKIKEQLMIFNDYYNNPDTKITDKFDENNTKDLILDYKILNNKLKAENLEEITEFSLPTETKQARGIGTLLEVLRELLCLMKDSKRKDYVNIAFHYIFEVQRFIIVFTGIKNHKSQFKN